MIGHEWVIQLLSMHIANNNVRHAYLFTGAKGSGRRTLAIRFSQSLNCTNPPQPGMPCLVCRTCQQIELGQHPDLMVIKAEQRGDQILIEQIRDVQHFLALSPYSAKYRIALFQNFEDANPYAENALLKTLEEPPERVVLILTAESTESLLPTIVSRCEPIALHPTSTQLIQDGLLKKYKLQDNEARMFSHISAGQPGLAIRYVQSPEVYIKRQKYIEDLFFLLRANLVERFDYAKTFEKDKSNAIFALETWISVWRDILFNIINPGIEITNLDFEEKIIQISKNLEQCTAHHVVDNLRQTLSLVEQNINLKLGMEVLILDLPIFPS